MIDREAEAALHNLHEYAKVKRELEVYKKALGLACNIIEEHAYCPYMCDGNRRCIDCLLQKARKQNDD